jgi:hypothetical protein
LRFDPVAEVIRDYPSQHGDTVIAVIEAGDVMKLAATLR